LPENLAENRIGAFLASESIATNTKHLTVQS